MLRTLTVASGTGASRVLGLLRDVVLAHGFGAGSGADAFFVAFRIPNLLRRLFAEGAFLQAFVPVLSEYREERAHDEVRDLIACTAGALSAILVLVTAIGVLSAPILVWVIAPGFAGDAERSGLTAEMLRLTFPYLLFISLTSLAAGVLNTFGRFAIPAVTPALLNLSLIAAAVWLAPRLEQPVVALAWGVLLGGVVQLAFQLPFLWRIGALAAPRLRRGHEGVRRILKLILPALFGVSVAQVNVIVDTFIASFLTVGSISWLYYSDRLVEFPLGVFGIALATVILPSLSRQHVVGAEQAFSRQLDWALRLILVVGLPAAVALAVLAQPLLTTIFQYGAFDAHGVEMAARSLAAYAAGLVGFMAIKVLAPGFYARQNTRTPVRIAAVAMLANVVLNLILVLPLAHAGLALASALSAWLNAVLLLRGLVAEGVYRPEHGWMRLLAQAVAASSAMAVFLLWFRGEHAAWSALGPAARAGWLAWLVAGGLAVYAVGLLTAGLRPRQLLRSDGA